MLRLRETVFMSRTNSVGNFTVCNTINLSAVVLIPPDKCSFEKRGLRTKMMECNHGLSNETYLIVRGRYAGLYWTETRLLNCDWIFQRKRFGHSMNDNMFEVFSSVILRGKKV